MKKIIAMLILCLIIPVFSYASGVNSRISRDPKYLLKRQNEWEKSQRVTNTLSVHDPSSGATVLQTDPSTGTTWGNEVLAGLSTYVITGNQDLTTSANATMAKYVTSGRPIEINAAAAVVVRLPDMASLTNVTNQLLFINVNVNGAPTATAGVTVWSPTNKIVRGLGATWASGDTIWVNGGASGNTGYTITLKAVNAGSAVSPCWRAWTDADVLRGM